MENDNRENSWATVPLQTVNEDLIARLSQLRTNHKTCDVVIISNEKKIYAHKIILAANSSYFHCLFYGEFHEGQKSNNLFELDISQFPSKLVEAAIDNMYSKEIRIPTDPTDLANFLCLVSFMQFASLEIETSSSLCKHGLLTPQTCLSFLDVGTRTNNQMLEVMSSYFLKTHFQDVLNTTAFLELDFSTLIMSLKLDDVMLESEHIILEAVLNWVSFDLNERLAHLVDLLNLVRFEYIEQNMMLETMLNHKSAESSEEFRKEIESFIRKGKAAGTSIKHTGAIADSEICVQRKQRSYPEELVIQTTYCKEHGNRLVFGDPLSRYWNHYDPPKWGERRILFRWRTDLYGMMEDTGYLYQFNIFGNGQWDLLEACGSLTEETTKLYPHFPELPFCVNQLHVADDILFILCSEITYKQCVLGRFDLKNLKMIGNGKMLPKRVNPNSIVYTESCLYAFVGDELIKIPFSDDEGVKRLACIEGYKNVKHLAAIEKNGIIYFAGGFIDQRKERGTHAYEINKGWKWMTHFNQARARFQLGIFKNTLYAIGGNDGEAATVEVYDEVNDKWELDTSFPYIPADKGPTMRYPGVVMPIIPWWCLEDVG